MTQRPFRVLLVATHPVQYGAPLFRALAKDPRLDIQVAYCGMQAAEAHLDRDFGLSVKWDIPLLDGYPWVCLRNLSLRPGVGRFLGFFNPGIWHLISRGNFDAIVVFTGYVYATFWMALAAAKLRHIPAFFNTDAHELAPADEKRLKIAVKKWLWPRLFGLADMVVVHSSGGAALMRSLRIPEERTALFPYCVDNDWWIEHSKGVDRTAVRARWNIPEDAFVALFCAKLQPWKRPQDLLAAFAQAAGTNAYLVFAGDGALRESLESQAKSMGIADHVRFLGFVNQSGLPETYCASDVLVLPSSYEPFGVVVNEAMLCGCAVIVSDRVGARFDLVRQGETGFVFPSSNVGALAGVLRLALSDRSALRRMGEAARDRMATWSLTDYDRVFVESISKGVAARKPARAIEVDDRHLGEPGSRIGR
jgi:glycosyltransferase involved in cell wall biosynthesis